MERPTGVTILAILAFLGAGAMALVGVLLVVGMGMIGAAADGAAGTGGAGMAMLAGLGVVGAVLCMIFGAVHALMGWGLWTLKNWARVVTMVLTAVGVVLNGMGFLVALMAMEIFSITVGGAQLALGIFIVMYLNKPHVKQAFAPHAMAAAASA